MEPNTNELTTPEGVHVIFDEECDTHGFTEEELEGENVEEIQAFLQTCSEEGGE